MLCFKRGKKEPNECERTLRAAALKRHDLQGGGAALSASKSSPQPEVEWDKGRYSLLYREESIL